MKKSESQNSLHSENKLEKILGHVIINEFDASTKCYYNRKKYKVKWADNPNPKWELESNLEKYKIILNKYKKLYENNKKSDSLTSKEYKPTFYSEYNMRLDKSINVEDNNLNSSINKIENLEKKNDENKIMKKGNKKLIHQNKINDNSKEKISEIIEIDEDESSSNESNNNILEPKNDMKNQEKNINLNKNLHFSSDYLNFGPDFAEVLNVYNNKKIEKNKENAILLNKKRKLSNSNDSFTISIDGLNSESILSHDSNESNNLNKIHKIIVPKVKTENLSILYKNNPKQKNLTTMESNNFAKHNLNELFKCYEYIIKSNLNKISKEELIKFYEKIIKKYFAGNTFDINL